MHQPTQQLHQTFMGFNQHGQLHGHDMISTRKDIPQYLLFFITIILGNTLEAKVLPKRKDRAQTPILSFKIHTYPHSLPNTLPHDSQTTRTCILLPLTSTLKASTAMNPSTHFTIHSIT